MLPWAGTACTIAKWCLLISVRKTYASCCGFATKLDLHNRPSFGRSSQESSFCDQCMSPLSTGCHLIGSLSNSLSSSLVHDMRQFCCCVFQGSSHHVVFLHEYSWTSTLHKLRCGCLKCVQLARMWNDATRAGQEHFQSKGAHRNAHSNNAFTRSQHGFH